MVTICLVSFATALTVFTLNIHHKGERGNPVPFYVKIVAFKYLARFLWLKLDPPDHFGIEKVHKLMTFYKNTDQHVIKKT